MATVSERSLIRMGAGGLVVVIPKAWARYYGLRPGDRVEVITNGKLVVKPKRKPRAARLGKVVLKPINRQRDKGNARPQT